MLFDDVLDSIGGTPMFRLKNLTTGSVFVKAEYLNPGGSIKDRVARHIIERAEEAGDLKPGYTIVEATSGNTGIGLTLVGRAKGYKVIAVMPEGVSEERKKIIRAYGGEIVIVPGQLDVDACVAKANKIVEDDPKTFLANQFGNPNNPKIHYETTGPEIWKDMAGKVDIFVAGVGSGGTIQGVGTFLREHNPQVKLAAVEPAASAALLGREPGLHQIQGIGDGFVPAVLDVKILNMVVTVTDEEAIETTRELAAKEGLLAGTSSGANVFAALQLAAAGKNVVTVLPDRAERYFSTALI